MRFIHHRHSTHSEQGQSLVEMALMMVILLTILSGVLDLGRGFFSFIAIQNAAGEGALYAAINPHCATSASGPNCADPNNIAYRTQHESQQGGLVDSSKMTINVTYPAAIVEGQPITVTVGYEFKLIGPFSPAVPGGLLTFQAHAMQNILDVPQ